MALRRQFLHDGMSPQEAAAAAGATAGRAVIFAGVTVAISITGLALIGLDFITKLGIGSALGVLTAVLLANSLLPAVLWPTVPKYTTPANLGTAYGLMTTLQNAGLFGAFDLCS